MKIIIEVKGGLVQAVYANGDVDVEVVDLDVSDFFLLSLPVMNTKVGIACRYLW